MDLNIILLFLISLLGLLSLKKASMEKRDLLKEVLDGLKYYASGKDERFFIKQRMLIVFFALSLILLLALDKVPKQQNDLIQTCLILPAGLLLILLNLFINLPVTALFLAIGIDNFWMMGIPILPIWWMMISKIIIDLGYREKNIGN